MALLFLGLSKCPVCDEVIENASDAYSFPHFVANINDPLYLCSDSSFHERCLHNVEWGALAMKYADLYVASNKRICIIGNNLIDKPEHYLFIPYITSDENEYLHKWNFTCIDKRNLANWPDREEVVRELRIFKEKGHWKENPDYDNLGNLINELAGR